MVPDPDALDTMELAAWKGFLRAHARLVGRLDEELRREHDLPLTHYDVLVTLDAAPGRRMRMRELADAVVLSRSGLTRCVDRLAAAGLLEREPDPDDARGAYARLTGAGERRLREARPTHLAGVRRMFLGKLSKEQRRRLGETWTRLDLTDDD